MDEMFRNRLYNSLPKYIREKRSVNTSKFKFEFKFIPEKSEMPNYVTPGIKSILD